MRIQYVDSNESMWVILLLENWDIANMDRPAYWWRMNHICNSTLEGTRCIGYDITALVFMCYVLQWYSHL